MIDMSTLVHICTHNMYVGRQNTVFFFVSSSSCCCYWTSHIAYGKQPKKMRNLLKGKGACVSNKNTENVLTLDIYASNSKKVSARKMNVGEKKKCVGKINGQSNTLKMKRIIWCMPVIQIHHTFIHRICVCIWIAEFANSFLFCKIAEPWKENNNSNRKKQTYNSGISIWSYISDLNLLTPSLSQIA